MRENNKVKRHLVFYNGKYDLITAKKMNDLELREGIDVDDIGTTKDTFYFKHKGSGRTMIAIGFNSKDSTVCAPEFSATVNGVLPLSDCTDFEYRQPLTKEDMSARAYSFGLDWD